jgi:hypothetical protein
LRAMFEEHRIARPTEEVGRRAPDKPVFLIRVSPGLRAFIRIPEPDGIGRAPCPGLASRPDAGRVRPRRLCLTL